MGRSARRESRGDQLLALVHHRNDVDGDFNVDIPGRQGTFNGSLAPRSPARTSTRRTRRASRERSALGERLSCTA